MPFSKRNLGFVLLLGMIWGHVDTATDKLLGKIGGFVGEDAKGTKYWGPSGVVVIPSLSQAWAGDGDSNIKVVDLQTQKVVDTISTGGNLRADDLANDDRDQGIMIGNDFDAPPFLTFISTQPGHKILGRIPLNDATDGLEQPGMGSPVDRFCGMSLFMRSGLIAALLGGCQRVNLAHAGSLHQPERGVP